METNPNVITLAFFCGKHQDVHRDVHALPLELMMSLLLQLIAYHTGFHSDILGECISKLEPMDVYSIYEALEELVGHLPTNVILCVVLDIINLFR
jgi:hypothetical protein